MIWPGAGAGEDPIVRVPVWGMIGLGAPTVEVNTGVEGAEPGIEMGNLIWWRLGGREFTEAQVSEMAFGSFGFEAEIAAAGAALGGAGDDLAIDGEGESTVVAFDAVVVPLAEGSCAVFAGEATFPSLWVRPVGFHAGAMDGEDIAVPGPEILG